MYLYSTINNFILLFLIYSENSPNELVAVVVHWPPDSKKFSFSIQNHMTCRQSMTKNSICKRLCWYIDIRAFRPRWYTAFFNYGACSSGHCVATVCLTTHLLSIERADWPKLHDVFKARDAKAWQREFPVGIPVKTLCFKFIIHQSFSRFCCLYRKQMRD